MYEVASAPYIYVFKGRNAVDVLESSVDDGYHHALAATTKAMQTVTAHRRDLSVGVAIRLSFHAIMVFKMLVVLAALCRLFYGVGSHPHQTAAFDERQLVNPLQRRGVCGADENGIPPAALSNHVDVLTLYLTDIAGCDGQVCRVYRHVLALAPFNGAVGKVAQRVLQRVSAVLLVS